MKCAQSAILLHTRPAMVDCGNCIRLPHIRKIKSFEATSTGFDLTMETQCLAIARLSKVDRITQKILQRAQKFDYTEIKVEPLTTGYEGGPERSPHSPAPPLPRSNLTYPSSPYVVPQEFLTFQ